MLVVPLTYLENRAFVESPNVGFCFACVMGEEAPFIEHTLITTA